MNVIRIIKTELVRLLGMPRWRALIIIVAIVAGIFQFIYRVIIR